MKRVHKLKSQCGFTLAETLLTVLILLLVSGIVATGIPVAKNVYDKTIVAANAQVLLSTTVAALKDELGTAWDVDVEADGITYYSADTGTKAKIYIKEEDDGTKTIMVQDYAVVDGLIISEGGVGTPRPLISAKTATDKLYTVFPVDSINKTDMGTICINNIEVCKDSNPLAKLDSLVIRPVSIHKE